MFFRSSPVTVLRRALSATCTGVTSDVTVRVSVSAPTSSLSFPKSRISAADSAMSATLIGLKLVSSILTVYRPGSRPAIRNNPFSLETTVRLAVVSASVTVTVAPGTADPCASTTVPVNVPVVPPCANADEAPTRQTAATTNGTTHTHRTLFIPDSFQRVLLQREEIRAQPNMKRLVGQGDRPFLAPSFSQRVSALLTFALGPHPRARSLARAGSSRGLSA